MKVSRSFIAAFLLPATLLYLIFFLVPTFQTFYYSLFDWSGVGQNMTFLGLDNYKELLGDHLFRLSMKNTLLILFIGDAIVFGLAFMFTAMLNSDLRGRGFFRAVIFLPNVVATIALTTLWAYIYNPRFGMINSFFKMIGLLGHAHCPYLDFCGVLPGVIDGRGRQNPGRVLRGGQTGWCQSVPDVLQDHNTLALGCSHDSDCDVEYRRHQDI